LGDVFDALRAHRLFNRGTARAAGVVQVNLSIERSRTGPVIRATFYGERQRVIDKVECNTTGPNAEVNLGKAERVLTTAGWAKRQRPQRKGERELTLGSLPAQQPGA
jgi:hypothetical protein